MYIANCMWKTCIAEGITKKQFADKGMMPRPDSIEAFLRLLPMGFDPEVAGDTKATLQFDSGYESVFQKIVNVW